MSEGSGGVVMRTAVALPSGAFSFVMATGIVSVSLHLNGAPELSLVLLFTAVAGYLVLAVLSWLQLFRAGPAVRANLADPRTRFGYFTVVAASGVLVTRLVLVEGTSEPPLLWVLLVPAALALLSWFALTVIIGRTSLPKWSQWARTADGTWFLGTVAAQSVATVAATCTFLLPGLNIAWGFIALLAWALGCIWYLIVLSAVLVRAINREITAATLTPPYWITMGACAITVLSSAKILSADLGVPEWVNAIVERTAVIFWWFATALIPVILLAGFWRHIRRHVPLDSTVPLWSIVFPLGMYDVASTLIAQALDLQIAAVVGRWWVWAALGAWAATILLLLWRLRTWMRIRRPRRSR